MTRCDELEGVSLAGAYGLERYLGSEGNAAYFRTAFGPDERPAAVKLVPAEAADGENQLALWRDISRLAHPNLLALLDCGRADVNGDSFVYAIFEYPDDSLASAVANGPLSPREVDEVLVAAEGALDYLHAHDMVHTAVDVEHIVAVGDLIKLASECLRHASDSAGQAAVDDRALESLREHLQAGVKPAPAPVAVKERVAEPAAVALSPEPPEAALQIPQTPTAAPVSTQEPVRTVVTGPELTFTVPKRSPALPLLLAAIGAVAIAVLLAVTQRSAPDTPWTPVASAAPARPAPHVAAPNPPVSTPAAPVRSPAKPASVAPTPPAARTALPGRSRESWRVIVYTYNHREHAESKIQALNRQKLGFHAVLFAPRGADQAPFFVALGDRMTREEAIVLQRKAKAKGLPRDTFVRNFSE